MRVAVIGAGISGLVSAYVLAKAGADVVLYEKEDYLGGHAKTVNVDGIDLDLGFMVFNRVSRPLISLLHTFILTSISLVEFMQPIANFSLFSRKITQDKNEYIRKYFILTS
jgi:phytoene dehydrogenase-like protein